MNHTYVIAEIGVNHNGSVDTACRLIEAARDAGADAAKFQHFQADTLVSRKARTADYQQRNAGVATQTEMLAKLALTDNQLAEVRDFCLRSDIDFMCTPFDLDAVDVVVSLGVSAIKIGSGDLTYDSLLNHAASFRLPIVLSTGMATMDEVAHALQCVKASQVGLQLFAGRFPPITVLHCTSAYPTRLADVNLAAMVTMAEAFNVPVGYSDHTPAIDVAPLAVCLGATMIEKHITLDKTANGPDHRASLDVDEFKAMVVKIRNAEIALGSGRKAPTIAEQNVMIAARRSLHLVNAVEKGHILLESDLVALRPGVGIPPNDIARWIGKVFATGLPAWTQLLPEHFGE